MTGNFPSQSDYSDNLTIWDELTEQLVLHLLFIYAQLASTVFWIDGCCLFQGEITYLSCICCHLLRICIAINIKHQASNYQRKRNFKPQYVV